MKREKLLQINFKLVKKIKEKINRYKQKNNMSLGVRNQKSRWKKL